MASQAEKDTAAAKAKQGGGQAAKDTAAAKAKQGGGQAAIDTAAAKAKQNGGDGGTAADFADREAANGLTDTISAGRGGSGPSFADREAAAGLRNTTSGGVAMNATNPDFPPVGTPLGNDEFTATNNVGGGSGGGGGGGGGLAGIEIIWADQSISFIEAADLTDTYNDEAYWSLVLTVSSGSFDKTLAYDATADIFTTTGTAPNEVQTKYRLRLITQYTNGDGDAVSSGISAYGQYREVTLCINGSPRQSLIKVT